MTAPLKAPLNVCIWISDRCNLECGYCYAAPFSGKLMDSVRLNTLVDELIELEVFDITFSGGEPFLHPEIYQLVEKTVAKGMQVAVLSNGVCLNERNAARLAKLVAGERSFMLQVSLDSHRPEINDMTRGSGQTVLSNLKDVAARGVQMQVSTVLTHRNVDTAHLIIDELYPLVKRFHFLNIQRTASSLANPDLLLTDERAADFWFRLREHARSFPDDLFLPSLRIMMRTFNEEESVAESALNQTASFACRSCSAGITHINVDANLNVMGCDIAKDFTVMGNLEHDSFESVWNSAQAHAVRNQAFPACYRIKGPDNHSMAEHLRPEFACPY